MQQTIDFLQTQSLYGTTLWQYCIACIAFIGTLLALKFFQLVILKRLNTFATKTHNDIDDQLGKVLSQISPWFYGVISLYVALRFLTLPEQVSTWIGVVVMLVFSHQVIKALSYLLGYGMRKYQRGQHEEQTIQAQQHAESMGRILRGFVSFVLWVIVLLFIASNLGIDITSVVASLGIGGIAVALAVQNILSDVFSSFSIFIDKPFEVGHYIQVGDQGGVVEKIGLKTTRLRTLRGEELVISNQELTSARVQNFKTLEKRRDVIHFGVVYGLTQTALKKIPRIVKQVVEKLDHASFDRCHLIHFGGSSLDYELAYYIDSDDFSLYMNTKQAVLLGIYTQFAKEGIDFAYPTQTLFVEKGSE